MSESMDPNLVKIVIPQPTNGQSIILPQTSTSHRPSGSPKPANKKPAFNRAFKQAVFQNRGREDGSSNLRVTFTSNSSKSHDGKLLLPKSTQEVKSFPKSVQPVTALKPIKPKPGELLSLLCELNPCVVCFSSISNSQSDVLS